MASFIDRQELILNKTKTALTKTKSLDDGIGCFVVLRSVQLVWSDLNKQNSMF